MGICSLRLFLSISLPVRIGLRTGEFLFPEIIPTNISTCEGESYEPVSICSPESVPVNVSTCEGESYEPVNICSPGAFPVNLSTCVGQG